MHAWAISYYFSASYCLCIIAIYTIQSWLYLEDIFQSDEEYIYSGWNMQMNTVWRHLLTQISSKIGNIFGLSLIVDFYEIF